MIFYRTLFFCLLIVVYGDLELPQDCTHIEASGDTGYLYSQTNWGSGNYDNDMDECWVVTAPQDHIVASWTHADFSLEDHTNCNFDYLEIYCGAEGEDGFIGRYCGETGIEEPVYSSNQSIYIYFQTDGSVTSTGFQLYYEAMLPQEAVNGSNCGEYIYDYIDSAEGNSVEDNAYVGVVFMIIGLVVGGLILIGIIAAIVVCVCLGVCAASVAATSRQNGQVQTYPLQTYPSTYPQTVTPTVIAQPVAGYLPPVTTQAQAPMPQAVIQQPPPYQEKTDPPPSY